MSEKKKFKILCIDGGGIKGLYSASVLEVLEKQFETRLSDQFDLVCGTSTGGIIALGVSAKIPMKEIVQFYKDYGPKIFKSRWKHFGRLGNSILGIRQVLFRAKYSQKPLREALTSVFGSRKISESNNLLCIPAYNITEGEPRIFKYDYDSLCMDNDKTYTEVALATSAAPTYLPIQDINGTRYVDGGLYANNPILVGLSEYIFKWSKKDSFDGVDILSISSCEKSYGWSPKSKRLSFFKWRDTLFDCYSHGLERNEMFFLKQLSESGVLKFDLNIVRIENNKISGFQEKFISLDNASKHSMEILYSIGQKTGANSKEDPKVVDFFRNSKTINPKQYGK